MMILSSSNYNPFRAYLCILWGYSDLLGSPVFFQSTDLTAERGSTDDSDMARGNHTDASLVDDPEDAPLEMQDEMPIYLILRMYVA